MASSDVPSPSPLPLVRVVVADQHPIVRIGMRCLLASLPDLDVAGDTGEINEVHDLVVQKQPDMLILGMNLPVDQCIGLAEQLLQTIPHFRILVMSATPKVKQVYEMLGNRVAGYLSKTEPAEFIIEAIRAVGQGKAGVLSPSVVDRLRQDLEAVPPDRALLTTREVEVLRLVALGYRNQDIADRLFISPDTVRNHVARIFDKLGIHRRAEAVAWAWRNHIVGDAGMPFAS